MNKNDMFDLLINNSKSVKDKIKKENDRAIREYFKDFIKGNFLIRTYYKASEKYENEINENYNFDYFSANSLATGECDNEMFEICRAIIGIHRSNFLFSTDKERIDAENNEKYSKELIEKIKPYIVLRDYSSVYFNRKSILYSEDYIFYPSSFFEFVIAMDGLNVTNENKNKLRYFDFYSHIFIKSLSILKLIENGFIEECYSAIRSVIELFIKFLILKEDPSVSQDYHDFLEYNLLRNEEKELPKEFYDKFNNRINTKESDKINYLYFGWLDKVKNYHIAVYKNPYSINGMFEYLRNIRNGIYLNLINNVEHFYKICNMFVHANALTAFYPIGAYIEIASTLRLILEITYLNLCGDLKLDPNIKGIDVVSLMGSSVDDITNRYNEIDDEIIIQLYKNNKLL